MKFLAALALALICSCAQVTEDYYGTGQEGIVLDDGRYYEGGSWAHDAEGPEYGTAVARKLRFRNAWMSFHNYDTPGDVLDHTDAFESWFSKTKTDQVENGGEDEFILGLFG